MAFSGQTGTQPPQPLQPVSLMTATWPVAGLGPSRSRRTGRRRGTSPQAVQASASTIATSGSSSAKPFLRMTALWVTAARPEATLSAEVLGPWQAPAMKTPSTTVSTGRSLGWISLKKPSLPSGQLEDADELLVRPRDHAGHEDDEVDRDRQLLVAR